MRVLAEGVELLPLLFGVAVLGLALLALGRRRLGAAALGVSGALLFALSTPLVSEAVRGAIEARHPPRPAAEAPSADAIVLLGGGVEAPAPPRPVPDLGTAGDRLLHAARLYHAGKAPVIVTTGGPLPDAPGAGVSHAEAAARVLEALGVPREDVLLEERSSTTYESALYAKPILAAEGAEDILLVTSALHMPRALAAFRGAGIRALPAATDHEVVERGEPLALRLLPQAEHLYASARAWHELLGALAYRARGWTRPEAPSPPAPASEPPTP